MYKLGLEGLELRAPYHPDIEPVGPTLPPSRSRLAINQERRRRLRDSETEVRVRLLCSILVGREGPKLEARFWEICEAHQAIRRPVWKARDLRLHPEWFHEPWLYVDLDELDRSFEEMEAGLRQASRLGFRNLTFTSGPGAVAGPGHGPQFEVLLRQADRLGLRITTGMDLSPMSPLRTPVHPSRPADATELYAALLGLVAQELNRGVAGLRALDVDRWVLGSEAGRRLARQHALAGLIKIMMHVLAPRDVLIPELRSERSGLSFALPSLRSGTQILAAEGDTYHWRSATTALYAAIQHRTARPLLDALASVPSVAPHAARWVALSRKDLATSSATRESSRNLDLALGLLYALPGTPVLHHSEEAALSATDDEAQTARRLRKLNALRRPRSVELEPTDSEGQLALRTDFFDFRANLGNEPWTFETRGRVRVSLGMVRAGGNFRFQQGSVQLQPGGYVFIVQTVRTRP